jgi:hypothetical protein
MVTRSRGSGLTCRAFYRQKGISLPNLQRWAQQSSTEREDFL